MSVCVKWMKVNGVSGVEGGWVKKLEVCVKENCVWCDGDGCVHAQEG